MTVLRTNVTQRAIRLVIAMVVLAAILLAPACKTNEPVSSKSQPATPEAMDLCIASFPMSDGEDTASLIRFLNRNGVDAIGWGGRGYFVHIRPSEETRAHELCKVWKRNHPKSRIDNVQAIEND